MSCKILTPPLKGQDRARMKAFIASLRGKSNRAYIPDFSTTQRGSFPATELLTNGDFSNGTTGWTVENGTLTVSDSVARLTASSGPSSYVDFYQSVALTQYAPHVLRSFISDGAQTSALTIGPAISSAANNDYSVNRGMRATAYVPNSGASQNHYPALILSTSGYSAGAYANVHWASLARCISVDAGPDAFTYSDQIDHANWTKTRCSATANAHTAPDGTATAEKITEDGSNNTHFWRQTYTRTSQAEDWEAHGYFARSAGTRNVLVLIASDTGPTNYGYAYVNLATGAVMSTGTAGTATNVRAFVTGPDSGGYTRVHVIARLAASTTAMAYFSLANGAPTENYAGDSTSALAVWRCGGAQSSVPVRPAQTTSTAIASGTAQTGSGIYVKGLPVSTSGLLKVGDPVERSGQINFLTAPLDSDAAGLGYLQCGNPWKSSVADNDPIIVKNPMSKMILTSDEIAYDTGPGQFSAFQLEFIEDVT
jgi:hypothetical protein